MDLECLRERSSGKLVESVPNGTVKDVLEKARCPVGEVRKWEPRSGRHVFPPRYPKGTSLTDGDCKVSPPTLPCLAGQTVLNATRK